jgi:hypothetical protein
MVVEHRLQVFENKVKKIFGSKKDEVGEIRILHNMDLNDLQNT